MLAEEQISAHTNGQVNKSSKSNKKPTTHLSKKKDNSSVTKRKSAGSLKPGYIKKDVNDKSIQKNEAHASVQAAKVTPSVKRKSKAALTLANAKLKKESVTPTKASKKNEVKSSVRKETSQQILNVPPEINNTLLQLNHNSTLEKSTEDDMTDNDNRKCVNNKEHLSGEDELEDFDVLSQYSCMTDIDTSQDVDVSVCPLSDWKEEAFTECVDTTINLATEDTFYNDIETKVISDLSPLKDIPSIDTIEKIASQIELKDNDRKTLHHANNGSSHEDVGSVSEKLVLKNQTGKKDTANSATSLVSPKENEAEHFKIPKRIRISTVVADTTLNSQVHEENKNKDTSAAPKGSASDIDTNFKVHTLPEIKKRKVAKETLSKGVPKKLRKLDSAAGAPKCSDPIVYTCDTGLIEKDVSLTLETESRCLKNEVFNPNMKENMGVLPSTQDDLSCVSVPVCAGDAGTGASSFLNKDIQKNTKFETVKCQGDKQEEKVDPVITSTLQIMGGNLNQCPELSCDSKVHQDRITGPDIAPGPFLDTETTTKTKLGVSKQKKRLKNSRKAKDSEEFLILPDGTHDGPSLRIQLPSRSDGEKNNLTKKLTWSELKNSWPSILQWKEITREKRLDTEITTTLPQASSVALNVSLCVKPAFEESVLFEKDLCERSSTMENKTFDHVLVSVLEDLKLKLLQNLAETNKSFISTTPCDKLTITAHCNFPSLPSFLQATHAQQSSMFLQRLHESLHTMGYQKQEYQGIHNDDATNLQLPLLWSRSSTHSTHFAFSYSVVYSKTLFLLSPSVVSDDFFKNHLFSFTFQFCSRQKPELHDAHFNTSILTSLRDEWNKNQLPDYFSKFFDSHSKPIFWLPKKGKTSLNISSLPSPPYVNVASTQLIRVMNETVSLVMRNSTTQMGYVSFPALAIHVAQVVSNENSQMTKTMEFDGFYPQKVWLWVKRQEETNERHTSAKLSLLQKLGLNTKQSATALA